MSWKAFWAVEASGLLPRQSIGSLEKSLLLSIFPMHFRIHILREKFLEKLQSLDNYQG